MNRTILPAKCELSSRLQLLISPCIEASKAIISQPNNNIIILCLSNKAITINKQACTQNQQLIFITVNL